MECACSGGGGQFHADGPAIGTWHVQGAKSANHSQNKLTLDILNINVIAHLSFTAQCQ